MAVEEPAHGTPPDRDARRERRRDGEALLLEVAADLLSLPTTTRSRMFGADAVLVRGKVTGFVDAGGALVVKLPADRADALVEAGAATRMRMGRGEAREWVGVPQPGPDDPAAVEVWRELVHASYAHVRGHRAAGRDVNPPDAGRPAHAPARPVTGRRVAPPMMGR